MKIELFLEGFIGRILKYSAERKPSEPG